MDFVRASMTDAELEEEWRINAVAQRVAELLRPPPPFVPSARQQRLIEYADLLEKRRLKRKSNRK